jgi:hypothetical protein
MARCRRAAAADAPAARQVVITQSQADDVITDLVNNVVLALKWLSAVTCPRVLGPLIS